MPIVLIIVGIVLLSSALRGTSTQLFTLVRGDFVGPNNFLYWILALVVIGAIGYVPKLKVFSDLFLAVIVLVLVLKRGDPTQGGGGFFQNFMSAINSTTTASAQSGSTPAATPQPQTTASQNPFALPTLPQLGGSNTGGSPSTGSGGALSL
jgi:hypothetical protein